MIAQPNTVNHNQPHGWRSWVQTSSGVVAMLLVIQLLTGLLLAFYYVPSVDHAYNTVAFIEKGLTGGSWIRALHHHGSQWLPLFLFLHIIRLYVDEVYNANPGQWVCAVVLMGLVMAGGATGYSLPWDARAFFSTRVAEGILGGLPLVGSNARLWMLAGSNISTLTLSRFFALHVLVTPFLILLVVYWRLRGFDVRRVCWPSISRHVIVGGLVFFALAFYAAKFPAPLGPDDPSLTADFLPRPGAQFLWLYQSLKYLPGSIGSLVGVVLPGGVLLTLVFLPWLNRSQFHKVSRAPQRLIAGVILAVCVVLIVSMTSLSYLSDRRDPRTRQQLARQAADEAAFRKAPFVAQPIGNHATPVVGASSRKGPPDAYTKLCATCHGDNGEGARQGTLRFPQLIGVAAKPRRTIADIVALLDDPKSYGLEPPMKSFASKLTTQEKQQIAEWVVTLK